MKFPVLIASLLFVFISHAANAGLVVTMVGEVQEGTLNGTDLAGTVFTYEAIVSDRTDIQDDLDYIGTYAVDVAVLDFGTAGQFILGPDPGYFYWGRQDDLYVAGIALQVDPQAPSYDNGFQFLDEATALSDFAPNPFRPFEPFGDFDSAETFGAGGAVGQPLSGINHLGDALTIASLSPGLVAVTAVPEPSAAVAMLCLVPACLLRRSRMSKTIF